MILPDSKEKPHKGEVVAIGSGRILDNGNRSPIDVKVGDVVYFTQYAPDEIEVSEGEEKVKYLVIKHSSLLAKE
ncbi:MAG: co-chaperone GroES [Candidatus Peribacteria bacterium]|nr:co-chaperone GroES [Candidatus Peribacteria bacterium]